jgi:hypothetical protein
VEFKKGLKGVEDDIEEESNKKLPDRSARPAIAGPMKYDPYTGKPLDASEQVEG